jgi:amidase
MATSAQDLSYFARAVLSTQPWRIDPDVVRLPWQTITLQPKLRIGYYVDDGFMPASPACQRVVMQVVESLKAAGHEVFPFQPPNVTTAMKVLCNGLGADGGVIMKRMLANDPLSLPVKELLRVLNLWSPVRRILEWIAHYALSARVEVMMLEGLRERTVQEYWDVVHERNVFRKTFLDAWNAADMDFVVAPGFGIPAVPHNLSVHATAAGSYTVLYNVLNYPSGVLPVGTVLPIDTCDDNTSWNGTEHVEYSERELRKAYDVDAMKNAPLGVQLVGRPYEEERVLAFMEHVQHLLQK